jgi:hypothetical protein
MSKSFLTVAMTSLAVLTILPLVASDAEARKIRKPRDRDVRGAPAPIVGVGLPFVLLTGGYLYWRRQKSNSSQAV